MSARDEIRARAAQLGWKREDLWKSPSRLLPDKGADEFLKDGKPGELLATMMAAGDITWQPRLRVVAYYGINGQVTDGILQTPRQQALITGKHVDHEARVEGAGRKQQVLSWLEWGSA